MDNPIEQFRVLANRLRQEIDGMGLEMVGYSIVPSFSVPGQPDGTDMMQVVFAMKAECLLTPEERKANREQSLLNDEFESMMKGVEADIATDTETEKIEAAKEGTADLLKGFLDDD